MSVCCGVFKRVKRKNIKTGKLYSPYFNKDCRWIRVEEAQSFETYYDDDVYLHNISHVFI